VTQFNSPIQVVAQLSDVVLSIYTSRPIYSYLFRLTCSADNYIAGYDVQPPHAVETSHD